MKRYFFISVFLHLLIAAAFAMRGGSIMPAGFRQGSALPRNSVMPAMLYPVGAGMLEKDSIAFSGDTIGVAELNNYAHSSNLPPRYPSRALRHRWQGETLLLLQINSDGYMREVTLLKSSGYSVLDEAALAAAQYWRFHGLNRPVEVRFPVKFVLRD